MDQLNKKIELNSLTGEADSQMTPNIAKAGEEQNLKVCSHAK